MHVSPSFDELLTDLLAGKAEAAVWIVNQYTPELVALARRNIGRKLNRRIDPEDAVQSAYRSFFVRIGRKEFELGNGEDLWKLLVTITLNKIRKQGKFHHADKRDVNDEVSGVYASAPTFPSSDPGPAEAIMLVDEVEAFLANLPEQDRVIVELRLQGYNSVEIAEELGRAERTIRRILERTAETLRMRTASLD